MSEAIVVKEAAAATGAPDNGSQEAPGITPKVLEVALSLMKRKDEHVMNIDAYSKFVCVYVLDDEAKWHRANIQGLLFAVSRSQPPYFRIKVMNQIEQGTKENLTDDMHTPWDISVQGNFLFYRINDADKQITRGFWFKEKRERDQVASVITAYVNEVKQRLGAASASGLSAAPPPGFMPAARTAPAMVAPARRDAAAAAAMVRRPSPPAYECSCSQCYPKEWEYARESCRGGGSVFSTQPQPRAVSSRAGGGERPSSAEVTNLLRRLINTPP